MFERSASAPQTLLALVVAVFLPGGCVPAKQAAPPDKAPTALREGVVTPSRGGRCAYSLIATTEGTCHLIVQHHEEPVGSAAPTWSESKVPCGKSADICGESVECDCTRAVDINPCGGQPLNPIHRDVSFAEGYRCDFKVFPPRYGECFVRGARMGTRPGAYGVADWSSTVAFGETKQVCAGLVDVSCTCAAFAAPDSDE